MNEKIIAMGIIAMFLLIGLTSLSAVGIDAEAVTSENNLLSSPTLPSYAFGELPEFIVEELNKEDNEETENVESKDTTIVIREFLIGRIDELNEEENEVSFMAKNVRGIGYMRNGKSGYFWYHHYKKMTLTYTGLEFRGILGPRIIFGVFSVRI